MQFDEQIESQIVFSLFRDTIGVTFLLST
ncbi:hypothetical protein THALO_250059 [Tenacibaculum halocynthiae]